MSAVEVEQLGSVAWVWLNLPNVHNAFDAETITELTDKLRQLGASKDVRAVVLAGRGRSFCAGAQAQWMQQQGAASEAENMYDARRLAKLFQTLSELPKPTIARVHGAALGGGVGLVACCDIAVGVSTAVFATSEVRLGLIPATIGRYVIRVIGERQARNLFQTGERIDAHTAMRIGLLHEVVEPDELDARIQQKLNALLAGAPGAQAEAKALIAAICGRTTEALNESTAKAIAERRRTAEAKEGLTAFLEKRPPAWVVEA